MYIIKPRERICKAVIVPADKSISHRAILVAALAKGTSVICPFLTSDDTEATLECLKKLGVRIAKKASRVIVQGRGLFFSKKNSVSLFARQSGTTLRLLSGILCGQKFASRIDAHRSLRRRPMKRILVPLGLMGADIRGVKGPSGEAHPPLTIRPVSQLREIEYVLPVASAQVKSAIVFASLFSRGVTKIVEPQVTRDHTERMLTLFGAKITRRGTQILTRRANLSAPKKNIFIPSDFSSAAFFIVLGLIAKRSQITIKNVSINPTRCYLLEVLKRMGARITISAKNRYFEPYADIVVSSSSLRHVTVTEDEVPLMIDEIPILCVAASYAEGKSVIRGVGELKVKETDRIVSMVENLKRAGVRIRVSQYRHGGAREWRLEINGATKFKKGVFRSFGDHRTAMSMIVFGLASDTVYGIDDVGCIDKSFPEFIDTIEAL